MTKREPKLEFPASKQQNVVFLLWLHLSILCCPEHGLRRAQTAITATQTMNHKNNVPTTFVCTCTRGTAKHVGPCESPGSSSLKTQKQTRAKKRGRWHCRLVMPDSPPACLDGASAGCKHGAGACAHVLVRPYTVYTAQSQTIVSQRGLEKRATFPFQTDAAAAHFTPPLLWLKLCFAVASGGNHKR